MKNNPLIDNSMVVVVLGLGVTGVSAIRYLHGQGAKVYVSDSRSKELLAEEDLEAVEKYCSGIEMGGHTEAFLGQADLIFISPGVPSDLEVIRRFKEAGGKVVGELALAAPVLESEVIAITGTNGKTTVTTLIGEIIEQSGKSCFVGGNIGRPLLECLMLESQPEIAVLEISSFQLEHSGSFRPDVGVLLNITPDHLDRHVTMESYIKTKVKLFEQQSAEDTAIVCADNVICMELADNFSTGRPMMFGHSKECDGYICESQVFARYDGKIEQYLLNGTSFNNHIGSLNAAAAILASRSCGVEKKDIDEVFKRFTSLPHRMELVAEVNGVSYFDDSKATNTGAVISALSQAEGKVILIAGGRDKGDDYSLLRTSVAEKVKLLILIGEAAEAIGKELSDITEVCYAGSMDRAVDVAAETAEAGDSVLLSPACASFDMFSSYHHRGEVFCESVRRYMAKERG